MFTFENLSVYKISFGFGREIFEFCRKCPMDDFLAKQLKRATLSISLNIAEGSGRFSMPDRRHFFVISRGSALEVAVILKYLIQLYPQFKTQLEKLHDQTEEISRTLFSMIKGIETYQKKR